MVKEDYVTAEKYYKAALEISPEDEDALLNLANAQVKAGKPAEAIYNFSKITAKNSENLEAFLSRNGFAGHHIHRHPKVSALPAD